MTDLFPDFEKVSDQINMFLIPFTCDIEDVPSNVIDLQSNDALKLLLNR